MADLDIIRYDGEGYKSLVYFEGWRVAILNHDHRFDRNYISQMERHMRTDEVFVLLSGEAVLVTGEEQKITPMEKNTIYNVRKAVWHAICVSKDARVLIVENADTAAENSEYMDIVLKKEEIPV